MELFSLYKQILNEGKSRGVLYHFTNSSSFQKNLKNQGFSFRTIDLDLHDDPRVSGFESSLSTTRSYNLKWGEFRFNLNGGKISTRYRILPIHFWNISDDSEHRTKGHDSYHGNGDGSPVPVNQYEETIFSKRMNEIMPLTKEYVYSVDILGNEVDVLKEYGSELALLKRIGIPYNFVSSFMPFKGVEDIEVGDSQLSINRLLKLHDEDSIIELLRGIDNTLEILSDARVIGYICSRGYTRLLGKMLAMDIDLGINDYEHQESKNMWTGRVSTSRLDMGNYVSLRAAGNNLDVLYILCQSDYIDIDIRSTIIIRNDFKDLDSIVYESDIDNSSKVSASIRFNDYETFVKLLDVEVNKNRYMLPILGNIGRYGNSDIVKYFLNHDDVKDSTKEKILTKLA